MSKLVIPGWPSYTKQEIDAVSQVLLSNKVNYWTGNECRKFEKEFSEWVGVNYAIALSNGTVALDLALKALKIGPGDEVIVTPRTFIASVSCIINAGAIPVFADVDLDSGNITATSIKRVITSKTKAIICVHLAGWPCDMDPIIDLAEAHKIKIIEDCAQAHGAKYKGRSVGSIGHIGAWSFCQDKIMTTGGEGGMVTTNDEALWRAMWSYKDHGKSYQAVYERDHPPGFRWIHESFGTNWRMLEVQAAIGRIQLKKMPEWSFKRNKNSLTIFNSLNKFSDTEGVIRLPQLACRDCNMRDENKSLKLVEKFGCEKKCTHAFYKFYFYINTKKLASGWTRERIIEELNQLGVPCGTGACSEVYLEKSFDLTDFRPQKRLKNAKELGETSLMLMVHPTLKARDLNEIISRLSDVLESASLDKQSHKI